MSKKLEKSTEKYKKLLEILKKHTKGERKGSISRSEWLGLGKYNRIYDYIIKKTMTLFPDNILEIKKGRYYFYKYVENRVKEKKEVLTYLANKNSMPVIKKEDLPKNIRDSINNVKIPPDLSSISTATSIKATPIFDGKLISKKKKNIKGIKGTKETKRTIIVYPKKKTPKKTTKKTITLNMKPTNDKKQQPSKKDCFICEKRLVCKLWAEYFDFFKKKYPKFFDTQITTHMGAFLATYCKVYSKKE